MSDDEMEFDPETGVLKVAAREGVVYKVRGQEVKGKITLTRDSTLRAYTVPGYVFPKGAVRSWDFEMSPSSEEKDVPTSDTKVPEGSPSQVDAPPVTTTAGGGAQNPSQGSPQVSSSSVRP